MKNNFLRFARWAFAGYCLLMLWLLFGQRIGSGEYGEPWQNWDLKVFSTIKWFIHVLKDVDDPELRRHAAVNLVGNIVMFVPLGFFLPLFFKKTRRLIPFVLTAVACIVVIELIQLAAAIGCCDVDDLVLNLPGMLLGYLLFKILFRKNRTQMSL